MNSSELRFEYNFLASKLEIDNLSQLYEVADKLLTAETTLDELNEDCDVNLSSFVDKWVPAMLCLEAHQDALKSAQEEVKRIKAIVDESKKSIKVLEESIPTKAKSAAKVIKENSKVFHKLYAKLTTEIDSEVLKNLPMLAKVINKNT